MQVSRSSPFLAFTLATTTLLGLAKSISAVEIGTISTSDSSPTSGERVTIGGQVYETRIPESEESMQAYSEVKSSLEITQQYLREQILSNLDENQKQEFDLCLKRFNLKERSYLQVSEFETQIEKTRLFYALRTNWVHERSTYLKEAVPILKALDNNPLEVGIVKFNELLNKLNTILDQKEIKFPHLSDFRSQEDFLCVTILERMECGKHLTERFAKLKAAISKEAHDGDGKAQKDLRTILAEWKKLVSSFGPNPRWERWDPDRLSQKDYITVASIIEAFLKKHESAYQIKPESDLTEVQAVYAQLRERVKHLHAEIQALEPSCSPIYINLADNTEWKLTTPRQDLPVTYLTQRVSSSSTTQIFKYGHLSSTIFDDPSNNLSVRQNFTSSGDLASVYELSYEDGVKTVIRSKSYSLGTLAASTQVVGNKFTQFSADNSPLFAHSFNENFDPVEPIVYGKSGIAIYNFKNLKSANPKLTENQYLHMLARELDTPERLHAFVKIMMHYQKDNSGDYFQSPSYTLNTNLNGCMTGDCEDYSGLGAEILALQGIKAKVIAVPQISLRHAECAWIIRRPDGKFDAYTLSNYGIDRNGTQLYQPREEYSLDGYATALDALRSTMHKYKKEDWGSADLSIHSESLTFLSSDNGTLIRYAGNIRDIIN